MCGLDSEYEEVMTEPEEPSSDSDSDSDQNNGQI